MLEHDALVEPNFVLLQPVCRSRPMQPEKHPASWPLAGVTGRVPCRAVSREGQSLSCARAWMRRTSPGMQPQRSRRATRAGACMC